jgi:hypothetical protein
VPIAECPGLNVIYENIYPGYARYTLQVTTDDARQDKAFFKFRFDAPVISINVRG